MLISCVWVDKRIASHITQKFGLSCNRKMVWLPSLTIMGSKQVYDIMRNKVMQRSRQYTNVYYLLESHMRNDQSIQRILNLGGAGCASLLFLLLDRQVNHVRLVRLI
jgi:hypothetical protein